MTKIKRFNENVTTSDTKMFIIQSVNLPFHREWSVFNDWVSSDKNTLIENVRKYLEDDYKSIIKIEILRDGWLSIIVNGKVSDEENWLRIQELKLI